MVAVAVEVMKMLHARGFDTNQSCQALLVVVGTLTAEACRGDEVCLDDTLARFGKILRQITEDVLREKPDWIARSMADAANLGESKKLMDEVLADERADGYEPLMVRLPRKFGCRLCSTTAGGFHTTIVRKRLAGRKATMWAVMTLCAACIAAPETKDRAMALLAEAAGQEDGWGEPQN